MQVFLIILYDLSLYFLFASSYFYLSIVELFELNDLLNDTLQLYHETMTSIRKTRATNSERTPRIQSAPPALLDFSSPTDVPLLEMTSESQLISRSDPEYCCSYKKFFYSQELHTRYRFTVRSG